MCAGGVRFRQQNACQTWNKDLEPLQALTFSDWRGLNQSWFAAAGTEGHGLSDEWCLSRPPAPRLIYLSFVMPCSSQTIYCRQASRRCRTRSVLGHGMHAKRLQPHVSFTWVPACPVCSGWRSGHQRRSAGRLDCLGVTDSVTGELVS